MSYRNIYLEWSVGENDFLPNTPIGFEVDLSRDKHFHEISTAFSTFDVLDPTGSYRFQYSLDNGNTWIQYPWGDQGQTFSNPFLMRLEITPSDLGYTLLFNNGSLKKISADSKRFMDSTTLSFETIKDIDQYEDVLYLVDTQTIYKINGETLEPYDNSLPLISNNIVGIAVDESRKTLWQINQNSVWLRSIYGDLLWSYPIPEIDVEYSSSSSSSETSSSSNSSSSNSSSSSLSGESEGNSTSSSSESSESVGNESSSSSSESSLDIPSMYATGFDTFPQLQGTYYGVNSIDGYYIYHNDNGCILQHDPYGTTRWKLYLDESYRLLARDHYYKNTETTDPYEGGSDNYGIHMWWDVNNIPITGITGTISDV